MSDPTPLLWIVDAEFAMHRTWSDGGWAYIAVPYWRGLFATAFPWARRYVT